MVEEFFKGLGNISQPDNRIDFILGNIDKSFLNGNFIYADEILSEIKVNKFSISDLLAFLVITKAAKEKLKNRVMFVKKVKEHLEKIDPKRADKLLSGLE